MSGVNKIGNLYEYKEYCNRVPFVFYFQFNCKHSFEVVDMSGTGQDKVTVLLHLGEEDYVGHGDNIEQAKRRTSAGALMLTYYTYKTLPQELDKFKPERKEIYVNAIVVLFTCGVI